MNSRAVALPAYCTAQYSLSTFMEPADRVIVIGKSGHLDPVNRCRCSLTQQLSGPVTDTKSCAPLHLVISEEVVVVEEPTGEAAVGEEAPPHAVTNPATMSRDILAYFTVNNLVLTIPAG